MLKAYIDESGNSNQAPIFVIAGMVADADNWFQFEREWHDVLHLPEYNVPFFSMADCVHATNQFEGWDQEKRKHLAVALLDIILKYDNVRCFGAALNQAALNELLSDPNVIAANGEKKLGNRFWLAFQYCIRKAVERIQDQPPMERISIVYDRLQEFRGTIMDLYHRMAADKSQPEHGRLGGLCFDDNEIVMPLQAVDMLAYELREIYENSPDTPVADAGFRLIVHKRVPTYYLDKDELRYRIQQVTR